MAVSVLSNFPNPSSSLEDGGECITQEPFKLEIFLAMVFIRIEFVTFLIDATPIFGSP